MTTFEDAKNRIQNICGIVFNEVEEQGKDGRLLHFRPNKRILLSVIVYLMEGSWKFSGWSMPASGPDTLFSDLQEAFDE